MPPSPERGFEAEAQTVIRHYQVDPIDWARKHHGNPTVALFQSEFQNNASSLLWQGREIPRGWTALLNPHSGKLLVRTTESEHRRLEAMLSQRTATIRTEVRIYEVPSGLTSRWVRQNPIGEDASEGIADLHRRIRKGEEGVRLRHATSTNYHGDRSVRTRLHFQNLTITDSSATLLPGEKEIQLKLTLEHQSAEGQLESLAVNQLMPTNQPVFLGFIPSETDQAELVLVAKLSVVR
ncbi:MAG: hypothetical protein AAF191_16130 [Verrucomicrobiota bacterium]